MEHLNGNGKVKDNEQTKKYLSQVVTNSSQEPEQKQRKNQRPQTVSSSGLQRNPEGSRIRIRWYNRSQSDTKEAKR